MWALLPVGTQKSQKMVQIGHKQHFLGKKKILYIYIILFQSSDVICTSNIVQTTEY